MAKKLNFSIALGLAANGFKSGLNQAQKDLRGFSTSVKSAMGMIAGAFALGSVKAFAKECVNAYNQQIQAETKLSTVMKQRMNASDAEVDSIKKLAAEQQKLGVIGDEVQLAGAQQVATFLNNKKSIETLLPAMNNLLAQQKGVGATMQDSVGIANLFGKAMMGQVGALSRAGITFSEAEKKVLQMGTEEERAAMLAKVITQNVGEMNSVLAQTDAGKIQQMENAIGDMKEQIGSAIAPIVSELAPKITEFAQIGADAITSFITFFKDNFRSCVQFVVALFAGIKIAPILQSWVATFKASQIQIIAEAEAAKLKRENIEKQLLTKKKVTAAQELRLEKAKQAEIVAANRAAAISNQTIWSTTFAAVKAAGVLCWTTIKAAMVSTGIGALVMAVVWTLMKLWDAFGMGEIAEKCFNAIVGGIKDAWNWAGKLLTKFNNWYDSLSWVAKAVINLIAPFTAIYNLIRGIVDKLSSGNGGGSHKYRDKKTGKVYNSMEELNAANRKAKPAPQKTNPEPTKPTKTSSTSAAKTPAQQAAEDTKKALKDYTNSVKAAQLDIENGTKTVAEARQQQVSALETLYEAYRDAAITTGDSQYAAKAQEYAAELAVAKTAAEAAAEADQDHAEKQKKMSDALAEYRRALKKVNEAEGRDTRGDWKKTSSEKAQADLEFNLSAAEAQLSVIKKAVEDNVAEAIKALPEAENKVKSLKDALAVTEAKVAVEDLKEQMSKMKIDTVQQGWSAIKGTIDNISNTISTIENPDASGWEKFCSVIDTLMGLMNSFVSIMQTINTITELSTQLKNADTAATTTNTTAAIINTSAKSGEAVSGATASGAKLPFPYNLVAIAAGVAAVMGALAMIGSFSKGGHIGRFSTGGNYHGDFGLARVNEGENIFTANQSAKLFGLIQNRGISAANGKQQIQLVARGRDLVGVMGNETSTTSKSGRKTNIKLG